MTLPTVAVTILAYNHVPYIRRCLESAIMQAADVPLHILVGDDASDDGTSEIVAEIAGAHPALVTHVRHPRRIGGSDNYRFVLTHAKGRYIAQLDGDDYWLPGKLKQQVDYIDAHPEVAAVYTNAHTIREDGQPIGLFNDVGMAVFDLGEMLRRGNFLNNSSMLFRAELARPALDIDGPVLDYLVHLRHARSGLLAQLPEPLVAYRVSSQGSALVGLNDAIRQAYWKAILDVPRERVSDADFACGIADFLRRVLFRSLRTRRPDLLRRWTPIVFHASPYGIARTGLILAGSVVRTLWKQAFAGKRRLPDGRRVRVMYHH
jgi:glycosyltransferase involved in cell wall biosynthesis